MTRQYFKSLSNALKSHDLAEPVLVIDLERLKHNIHVLRETLPRGMAYRIVAKSLPSIELLEFVIKKMRSHRLMSFNAEMIAQLLKAFPEADQLLGKPLPAKRLKSFFNDLPAGLKAKHQRVQWLADTPCRLSDYDDIARALGVTLRVNLELDVGLHRGGFSPGENLSAGLEVILSSGNLTLSGVMGYEPHLTKIPNIAGWRRRAKTGAWQILDNSYRQIEARFGKPVFDKLVRNTAGSPTFGLYKDTRHSNELAAGSALVKPSDFDMPILSKFKAAAFIATPALKVSRGIQFPAQEFSNGAIGDMRDGTKVFVHGGYWMASPIYPAGLSYSDVFGRSSNQDLLVGGAKQKISVDDFVFLRPHQSEAVFLQFPKIAVYDRGRVVDIWRPLAVSA
mgnify:CR=1 FL=1